MLSRLSIRAKLLGGFGVVILLLVIVGGSGLLAAMRMQQGVEDLARNWLPSVQVLGRYKAAAQEVRQVEAALLLFTEPEARALRRSWIEPAEDALREAWRVYEPLLLLGEERQRGERLHALEAVYMRTHQETVRLIDAHDDAAARRVFADGRNAFEAFLAGLDAAIEYNARGAAAASAEGEGVGTWAFWSIGTVMALAVLLGVAIALFIGRSIATRVGSIGDAMQRMAQRDYSFTLAGTADQDEIGALARAVDTCRDGLREADRLAERQREAEAMAAQRAVRMDALIAAFDAEASDALRTVAAAATELDATAKAMGETADDGTGKATAVAAATEQASVNIQTVASSAEELAASIAEVARQVRDTAGITGRAADAARETDVTVRGLADSASRIGDVVRLISDIAGQTNLLALNATIEAARAGEAGKGFAVVASEVKQLAAQTARATEEIGQQIAAIQAETTRTVEAIAGIARTIEELNANTGQVAAASEQQAAATQEIGRAVAEAAIGTQEASRNAAGVQEGAERTGAAAGELRGASAELARQSERLRGRVGGFLADVRAA